jgi:hypothetical protein
MPERLILVLAKEYGRPPQEIEQEWEEWWTNRCIIELKAQAIIRRRDEQRDRPKGRR